jgi:HEAT repeat protein
LRGLLRHPAGPVRILAAIGLGKIGATDSIPDLQRMMADPETRNAAAIALVRLGQAEGEPAVQEMLRSESLDMRLFGADAYDHRKPGPWVDAITPALRDPNGLTRIRAAEALRDVAPEAALPVLREAAQDPNPVVRQDVSRVLEGFPPASAPATVDALRRMLRDADPSVRLHAAGAILQLARR